MKSTFQSSSNITEHQVTSQVPRSCSASLSTCRSRPVWEALNPFRASIKFIQKTGRLHFATSFTEKLKMIRCVARVRASSSTTELLVNGEGHRCRWFIYSPGEAFKLLKSISSADKLTYWSKATKDVICWSEQPWGHLGERKILFLLSSPVVGATGALKLSAESLFSPLFLWLQIDLKKKNHTHQVGDSCRTQAPESWNFRLRDEKWRLHVSDPGSTGCDWYATQRRSERGQGRESGVGAPAGSTSRLVSRCRRGANRRRHNWAGPGTSESSFYLNHEAERG